MSVFNLVGRGGRLRIVGRLGVALTVLAAASTAAGDEDYLKLAGLQPPYKGPGHIGTPIPAMNGRAGGFEADGITLLSWLPLGSFPGDPFSGNDCWGYTSPSGREYAIMGLSNGFGFVEVTDPTNPVILTQVMGPNSLWHDVKVIGGYAYGVSEGGAGIQVMDLSQIDDGIVRHVRDWTTGGYRTTHNIAANPESGYLYLCGANVGNGGLVAVDVNDPENPVLRDAWTSEYVHDAQIVTYTSGPYAGREIAFCASAGGALDVVDVTNKSNLVRIGGASYPGVRYAHQCWLSEDRQHLYFGDELDEGSSVSTTRTLVFDVSDPAQPQLATTFSNGLTATDHNQYTKGNLLFQANYMSGMRVWDLTSPTGPTEIGYIDTYPGPTGEPTGGSGQFHGAWSVFPYFASGTVVISDIERGMFVVRVGTTVLDFAFPEGVPTQLAPLTSTAVPVTIAAEGTELDPQTARANISFSGEPVQSIPLQPLGGNEFLATLPGGECFQNAEFWFSASTTDGLEFTSPFLPLDGPYTARVLTGVDELYTNDFESDAGWSVDNAEGNVGGWERGVSSGDTLSPPADFDGSGSCWVTGLAPGVDLDGGPTTLLSPALDLADAPEATISYAAWINTYVAPGARLDVQISNDDGASWTTAAFFWAEAEWSAQTFRVADYVTPTATVRVRFVASGGSGTIEAAVDAFAVRADRCESCEADFNGDGALDVSDFSDFRAAYLAGNMDADYSGNGSLGVEDFTAFRAAYLAGCP